MSNELFSSTLNHLLQIIPEIPQFAEVIITPEYFL
jgi:hypothetical protein